MKQFLLIILSVLTLTIYSNPPSGNCYSHPIVKLRGKGWNDIQLIMKNIGYKNSFSDTWIKDTAPYYYPDKINTSNSNFIIMYVSSNNLSSFIQEFKSIGWAEYEFKESNVEAIICNSGSIKYIISWENLGSTTKLSFTKLADPPPSTRSNSSNYNSRVYVCGGEYSVRFHSHPNCRGLNNCQSEVYYEDSEQDAVNNGYSYCNICWH